MLESSVQLPSNWSSSVRDSFLHTTDHSYSFDISNIHEHATREEQQENLNYSGSPLPNTSGSSCQESDWANFDEDINSMLPVPDVSISMLLDEGLVESIAVDLNWSELDIESFADQSDSTDTSENIRIPQVSKRKRKKSDPHFSSAQKWSVMSRDEQVETVEALTQFISQNVTLREQIEIIKVIDPSAVISPNDTEFAIDLGSLNDSKLQIIRNIVKKYTMKLSHDADGLSASSVSYKPKERSSHTAPTVSPPKQEKYEKRPYLEEIEMQQKKLQRQRKKEKRSGLFLCEQKVHRLNSCPEEEEQEVNIME